MSLKIEVRKAVSECSSDSGSPAFSISMLSFLIFERAFVSNTILTTARVHQKSDTRSAMFTLDASSVPLTYVSTPDSVDFLLVDEAPDCTPGRSAEKDATLSIFSKYG